MLGAVGVLGAASALTGFAKSSFEAADAIGDAAERAGVAVESLSKLKYAADQSDVDFSALTLSLKRWQVTLSQAASGSKDAASALGLLQLNASALKSLSLEDQLKRIADQFARIRDPADQTRVAVELFGRAGEQLVPLLKQGGGAVEELTKQADELGITLDQKTTNSVDAADKALKRFLATIRSAGERGAGNVALAIMGPQSEIDAAKLQIDKLLEQRKMLEESAQSAGKDAPAWFKRINADSMAKVNAQLEVARANLTALQSQAEASKPSELVIPKEPEKISEVTVTQRKAELEGLAKLLNDFELSTRTTEDKIYQDYRDTVDKIQELLNANVINAEEAARRIGDARIKFEDQALIDPVKITQTKVVVTQTLTEQQRAVDKFVDTLSTGLDNLAHSGELTGKAILKYLLSAFESQILKDAIEGLGNYLKKSLGGSGSSGAASGFGSFLAGLFGHAAGGGRMSGPRIVGEDGPELDLGGGNIMNRRQLAFAMSGAGGNTNFAPTTVINVAGNADNSTLAALPVILQQNNKKLLEEWSRRMKDNFGRAPR